MKIFNINGGLGRVIAALPALIKYYKNHSEEEWYVMISGWGFVSLGIPELQERTFDPETKGVWENIFLKADEMVSAEPYHVPNFYKGKISIAEAFDEIINETNDHSDLDYETIKLSYSEINKGQEIIYRAFEKQKKVQTIVINPYASSAQMGHSGVHDESYRSLPDNVFLNLCKNLSKKYNIIYMGYPELLSEENEFVYAPQPDINLRDWMGVICQVDYFIGVDTAGQHIARATDTKGCVIMGGTDVVNMSYPDYFRIVKRKTPHYTPLRISQLQSDLANRLNHECMEYTEDEISDICDNIINDVDKILTLSS
jgi:hypothetical protein